MRLRGKLLVLLVPLVLAPLLGVGAAAYLRLLGTAQQTRLEQMEGLVGQVGLNITSLIRAAEANLALFSASALLEKYALTADERQRYDLMQPPLLRQFKGYQQAYPEYYEIRVILPDGYEDLRAVSHEVPNQTDAEGDTPAVRAMLDSGRDLYTAVVRNPDDARVVLLLGKRLMLRDPVLHPLTSPPSYLGYLVVTVDLESVQRQVDSNPIGREGFLFATDAAGRPLFRPRGARLVPGSLQAHAGDDEPLPSELFGAVLRAVESRQAVVVDAAAGRALVSGRRLHPGLYLFAWLPEDELLAEGWALGETVAAITAAAVLITVALIFVALRLLVLGPIGQLSDAARAVGRGDLTARVGVGSADEIGDLTRAFTEMGESLQRSNERIRHLAYHDPLTGLPNRLMFKEYLARVLAQARRQGLQVALLFLDLDNFKRVNDGLGHHVGDGLLQAVAERLGGSLRGADYLARRTSDSAEDLLARLGGDEFILLLSSIRGAHEAGAVARRVLDTLEDPFRVADQELHVAASIGITLFPGDGSSPEDLIKHADIAMYHAKEQGRGNFQFFSDALNAETHRRVAMESRLRRALSGGEFRLLYQPQVDLASGLVVGVEALLRWEDPELGVVSPESFIPVAEETGLVVPIGEWVFEEAARQARAWQVQGLRPIRVGVNVSGIQFQRQDLTTLVAQVLDQTGLPAECLEVELTEGVLFKDRARTVRTLQVLRDLGVRVSLDDFGTGYSSLSYLRRFPIDRLKIDRSFVREVATNREDAAIISAIITMAHAMDIQVVAEGVEQDAQIRVLKAHGCDLVQGHLLYRPMSAEAVAATLRGRELRPLVSSSGLAG